MANDATKAVRMAQTDIESVIRSFKEQGHFMDSSVTARTQAVHDRLASAPDSVRGLLDQGFDQGFVDHLARLVGEKA